MIYCHLYYNSKYYLAYLEPYQISMMEPFCENSYKLGAFNCFRKKTPSYLFKRVLIMPR